MKCPVNTANCFGNVLYQISCIGILNSNVLTVDINDFKNSVKMHKYNLVLKKLCDNGFNITNHDGKGFIRGASLFDFTFPDMPAVINTLKGFALLISKYIADVKPSYHMYTHDMFGCFQYRFAEDETTRKYPEPLFMTIVDEYSDNGKRSLYWFHDKAAKYGYKCTSGFNTTLNFMKSNKSFMKLCETDDKKIIVILSLENVVNRHIDMINALPEYLQEPFKESTCIFCGGIMAPGHSSTPSADEQCKQRLTYEHDGEFINHSKRWFSIKDVKYDDLPHILELYKTENNFA